MNTVTITSNHIRIRHEAGDSSWTFRASKGGTAVYSHAWGTPEVWRDLPEDGWQQAAVDILASIVANVHPIGSEDALRKLSEAVTAS
jgi:hypothetical protein